MRPQPSSSPTWPGIRDHRLVTPVNETEWRLIVDGPAEGSYNMAVDRAMLDAHESGMALPTLRLYTWRCPTVSLGRFQPLEDVDRAACDRHGVELCRRPTGGRGVLHADELTYSIVAGVSEGLPRGVSQSYRTLCLALVAAFRLLGIDAALTSRSRGPRGASACYLHSTPADLSLGAAKLSGSAQVWTGESCLQHGSFVISRDIARESDVFRLDTSARSALGDTTGTIEDALGMRPDAETLRDAVIRGVEETLCARLTPGTLSAEEQDAATRSTDAFRIR